MAKKMITVYIGRFQPLHCGHVHVLEKALATSDLTIVLIGSAFQARTIKNPFTFAERRQLLYCWHRDASLHLTGGRLMSVQPLIDQPYNNAKWIQSVQEAVHNVILEKDLEHEDCEIFLTGSDRDESTWYLNAFPQWQLDLMAAVPTGKDLSATNLRHQLFKNNTLEDWGDVPPATLTWLNLFHCSTEYTHLKSEYDFIEKYKSAWKAAPYAPTFLTVDAVVVQSGHILVVERGALPGKGLWALPGGFLNQNERLEDAVIRELVEETGIKVPAPVLKGSIKAHEIFDDPSRSLRGRTVTTAFLIRLDDSKPLPRVKGQLAPLHETYGKAVVETTKAFWLPIHEARANSEKWFEDHHGIIDWAVGMIKD